MAAFTHFFPSNKFILVVFASSVNVFVFDYALRLSISDSIRHCLFLSVAIMLNNDLKLIKYTNFIFFLLQIEKVNTELNFWVANPSIGGKSSSCKKICKQNREK